MHFLDVLTIDSFVILVKVFDDVVVVVVIRCSYHFCHGGLGLILIVPL